jgi:hypothetical protein
MNLAREHAGRPYLSINGSASLLGDPDQPMRRANVNAAAISASIHPQSLIGAS